MTGEFSVAVHALLYLARRGAAATSTELAANICTNPARVRKVMALLVHAGLVKSGEGRGNGYTAGPGVGRITLLRVLDALGERAVSAAWRTGAMDGDCLISSGIGEVMDGLCEDMNDMCREHLSGITISDIEGRIARGKRETSK